MEQWPSQWLMGWEVMGLHLGLGSNPGRKDVNVLFNDTLNTLHLRLYSIYSYIAFDIW